MLTRLGQGASERGECRVSLRRRLPTVLVVAIAAFASVRAPRLDAAEPPTTVATTSGAAAAALTERAYLSGTDTDHTVAWDFFCTANRNSGNWTTIPVPSCWDVLGFGNLRYGD